MVLWGTSPGGNEDFDVYPFFTNTAIPHLMKDAGMKIFAHFGDRYNSLLVDDCSLGYHANFHCL